ncbi:DUF6049 family protein [Sphaerisporangium siamense]|uniref:Glycoprotein n=1 Tax=Sphaerisporangium siamense TaxID=795645 RepID=A0A7W7G8U7_9ACTN|nr:DUF6049 family protein [Sphaerisporangium siamense]MBB4699895.1 hypothetical protein [Sphaerisporangium siamense]
MTRGAALISVLTAAFLLVPAAVAGAARTTGPRAEPAAVAAKGRQDAQIVVSSITPQVPRDPSTPVKISGTVTNTSAAPMSWVSIHLRFSRQPFADRASMQAFADGGQILDSIRRSVPVSQLPASGKTPWEFTVTPAELQMFRFGVYPITIVLANGAGQQIAAQRGFLPYAPGDQNVVRTKISWALPLVDQPHRGDDATFVDEGLKQSLADNGRLGKILKIAETPAKGVTWFVDPALLDDARAMSQGYSLMDPKATAKSLTEGAGTSKKPADQNAAQWLRRLRTALTDVPVSATPYADPDVAAVSHQGLDSITRTALDTGTAVATELLGKDVTTDVNWPVGGVIDHDGLDALSVGDVRTVLLSSAALPPNPPIAHTPDAAAGLETVDGTVGVVMADDVLSRLLTADPAGAGGPALLTQRFLAETVMIGAERPQEARTVVAAPPRRWNPDPALVTSLLKAVGSAPWLKPVTLDSIKPGKVELPRGDLAYTDKDKQAELGKSYLSGVRKLSRRADLTAVVTGDRRRVFDTALLRLASAAWRGHTGAAAPLVKQVDAAVTTRTNAISVTTGEQERMLAGKNGVVPISIRNDLPDQEVTVGVKITSGDRKLLAIGSYESPVTISPGKTRPIDIPLIANGGGQATIKVQLTSENGVRYGAPVEVTVRTTGYTGIALVIVGAALAVMLAAVTLRFVRRRQARRPSNRRRGGGPPPPAVPEPVRPEAVQHREGPA